MSFLHFALPTLHFTFCIRDWGLALGLRSAYPVLCRLGVGWSGRLRHRRYVQRWILKSVLARSTTQLDYIKRQPQRSGHLFRCLCSLADRPECPQIAWPLMWIAQAGGLPGRSGPTTRADLVINVQRIGQRLAGVGFSWQVTIDPRASNGERKRHQTT